MKLHYRDGLRFLRGKQDEYDLIINDSTDPLGHTAGLFTKEFYGSCYKALKDDGIMVYQHGSPFFDEDEDACRAMHRKAYKSFPISRVYQAHIPTCPSGYWLFGFASKKYHPLQGPGCRALEEQAYQDLVLHHQPSYGRLHAAEICGGSAGRGRRKKKDWDFKGMRRMRLQNII